MTTEAMRDVIYWTKALQESTESLKPLKSKLLNNISDEITIEEKYLLRHLLLDNEVRVEFLEASVQLMAAEPSKSKWKKLFNK